MTVIFNYITNTRLNSVPKNWSLQVKHFNTLPASVFPLYSYSVVQSWEVISNSWKAKFPSSPAHTIRMPHRYWSLKKHGLKAQIDKNKSVPSENNNISQSTNLELSDNSKEPEEVWGARTFPEITFYVLYWMFHNTKAK